jgi:hypothetical protein
MAKFDMLSQGMLTQEILQSQRVVRDTIKDPRRKRRGISEESQLAVLV